MEQQDRARDAFEVDTRSTPTSISATSRTACGSALACCVSYQRHIASVSAPSKKRWPIMCADHAAIPSSRMIRFHGARFSMAPPRWAPFSTVTESTRSG